MVNNLFPGLHGSKLLLRPNRHFCLHFVPIGAMFGQSNLLAGWMPWRSAKDDFWSAMRMAPETWAAAQGDFGCLIGAVT